MKQLLKRPYFYLLCLLGLLVPSIYIAQSSIANGYIVTKSNDTVRGRIVDKDWNISPVNIAFNSSGNNPPNTYTAQSIAGFGVDGKYFYRSCNVLIDDSPFKTEELDVYGKDDTVKSKFIQRQLFLNVLSLGRLNLYYHKDEKGKEHFFASKDKDTIVELILQRYMSIRHQGANDIIYQKASFTVEKYKYQLRYLMRDCAAVSNAISKAAYDEGDLIRLFRQYNECFQGEYPAYSKPIEKSDVHFGFVAGLGSTYLNFYGKYDFDGLQELNFKPSTNVLGGIGLTIPIEKSFHKHIIYIDMLVKPLHFSAIGNYYNGLTYVSTSNSYNFNLVYLKLDLCYHYVFYRSKTIDLYFGLGLSASYALRNENDVVGQNNFFGSISVNQGQLFPPRDFELGLLGSLGLKHNNWNVELRHERGNGMANFDVDFNSSLKSYCLLLGYNF